VISYSDYQSRPNKASIDYWLVDFSANRELNSITITMALSVALLIIWILILLLTFIFKSRPPHFPPGNYLSDSFLKYDLNEYCTWYVFLLYHLTCYVSKALRDFPFLVACFHMAFLRISASGDYERNMVTFSVCFVGIIRKLDKLILTMYKHYCWRVYIYCDKSPSCD